MSSQVLHSSKENIYWVAAARHYLDKQGHLDAEKITEKYFDIWSIDEIAKTLVATAKNFDYLVAPEISKHGIDIYSLTNFDSNTLKQVFEIIFPILEKSI